MLLRFLGVTELLKPFSFKFGGLTQNCQLFVLLSKGIFINIYQLLSPLPGKSQAHLHTCHPLDPNPCPESKTGPFHSPLLTPPLTNIYVINANKTQASKIFCPFAPPSPELHHTSFWKSLFWSQTTSQLPTLGLPPDPCVTANISTSHSIQCFQFVLPHTSSLPNFSLIKDVLETSF